MKCLACGNSSPIELEGEELWCADCGSLYDGDGWNESDERQSGKRYLVNRLEEIEQEMERVDE